MRVAHHKILQLESQLETALHKSLIVPCMVPTQLIDDALDNLDCISSDSAKISFHGRDISLL